MSFHSRDTNASNDVFTHCTHTSITELNFCSFNPLEFHYDKYNDNNIYAFFNNVRHLDIPQSIIIWSVFQLSISLGCEWYLCFHLLLSRYIKYAILLSYDVYLMFSVYYIHILSLIPLFILIPLQVIVFSWPLWKFCSL